MWQTKRLQPCVLVCAISPISFPNWVKHQRMSVLILASWHQLFQSLFNGMWCGDWNSGIYQRLLELHPAGLQSVQTATNATCFLAFFKNHSRTVFQVPLSAPLGVLSFETMDQRFKNKKLHRCIKAWFIHSPPHDMPDQTQQKTGWAESFAKITFNLVSRSFWRRQECSKLHQNTSNRSVIHGKCVWSSTRLIFARNVRSRKMFRCQESWRLLAQNNLYFFVDTFVC